MDFIEESTVKEHKDNVESSINALIQEIANLMRIILDQKSRIDFSTRELLDEDWAGRTRS